MTPGPVAGPPLPHVLRANTARHEENLARLAETLRSAGLDEPTVQGSLRTVTASYAEELQSTMRSIIHAEGRGYGLCLH